MHNGQNNSQMLNCETYACSPENLKLEALPCAVAVTLEPYPLYLLSHSPPKISLQSSQNQLVGYVAPALLFTKTTGTKGNHRPALVPHAMKRSAQVSVD